MLAGKGATADGSVMMTYNNDWSPYNAPYFEVVPATETTYGFVKILCIGDIEEGGINEHQFAVNYGTATGLDPAVLAADPYEAQGITGEFWDLLLQKCATCDEALDLIAEIAETRGFNSGCAGSLGFADTDEAWCFELLGGHHWVAQRVPDDAVLAHPNTIVVRQIDLDDPDNFRGSADLQEFAESIGRYDPAEGPFDVAWAYSDRERLLTYYNTNRIWGAFNSVAPSLGLVPEMPYETRPVWVVPDEPVTRQDIMAISRYHYEGTELDQTENYTLMSPHKQTNRPICDRTTDYSAVWQLRDWLPAEVGGVLWVAPGRPCASAYTPFYAGITSVPEKWAERTAAQGLLQGRPEARPQGQDRRRELLRALHPAGARRVRGVRGPGRGRAGRGRGDRAEPRGGRAAGLPDDVLRGARAAGLRARPLAAVADRAARAAAPGEHQPGGRALSGRV